jgi:hypothetical protein
MVGSYRLPKPAGPIRSRGKTCFAVLAHARLYHYQLRRQSLRAFSVGPSLSYEPLARYARVGSSQFCID